ncbi:MAG: cytochrome c [Spirulina sp. SIO3F2]|nr:cytochrome c [Spirulina sp. SIO3F2]
MLLAISLTVLLGIGLYFSHHIDPYIRAVIAAPGDPSQGHEIFEINCAGCHGVYATGNVGPSLENISNRKSDVMIIHQVISGETPPMPKFQPTAQEMADLLNYLKRL